MDFVAHIPRYPEPGGEGLANRLYLRLGGSVANTALTMACCGIEVAIIGRVGTGVLGTQVLADLQAGGVDVSLVQRDPDISTGIMFIAVTPDGERTMFGFRGANVYTNPVDIPETGLRNARHLHLSGYALLKSPQRDALFHVLEISHRAGLSTSLDAGLGTVIQQAEAVRSLLPYIDLFLPNIREAELLTGTGNAEAAIAQLREQGAKAVALKLGAQGSMAGTAEGTFAVPPFTLEVRDTTGAGDAFDAGVIVGRLSDLTWRAAALLGNALGALAVATEGTRSEALAREATVAFLRQQRSQARWADWQREFDAVIDMLC